MRQSTVAVSIDYSIGDEVEIHLVNMFLVGMMDNLKSCIIESTQ